MGRWPCPPGASSASQPPGDARTLSRSTNSPHQRGLDEGTAHRRRPAPRHRRHHHGRPALGLGRRGRGPSRAGRLADREHRRPSPRARAPRTLPTATRRRRPASRSGSCTAGEPGTRAPVGRVPGARRHARRAARRPTAPGSAGCRSAAATTAPPIDAILDEAIVGHVAWTLDGQPYATPTKVWRQGDRLFWHGSAASRMLRATDGQPVCVTVTHLDGFVLARSGFNHSVNYRSVMVLGTAHLVTDDAEVDAALDAFIEHLYPGRAATLRPMTAKERKATSVMWMDLAEASAKVRADVNHDDRGRRDVAGLGRGHAGPDGPRRARAGRVRGGRDGRAGDPAALAFTWRLGPGSIGRPGPRQSPTGTRQGVTSGRCRGADRQSRTNRAPPPHQQCQFDPMPSRRARVTRCRVAEPE